MVKATFAKNPKNKFPEDESRFLMGETLICSIVPISFSETMFMQKAFQLASQEMPKNTRNKSQSVVVKSIEPKVALTSRPAFFEILVVGEFGLDILVVIL